MNRLAPLIARLVESTPLLVGLDFDGVLSEIVAVPDDARPVDGVPEAVAALAASRDVRVASVSGRRRDDLAARFDWPDSVILIGEHGADAGRSSFIRPDGYTTVLDALRTVANRFPGAWVEEKRSGVTLHGRALSESDAERLAVEAERVLEPLAPGSHERGNRVVDVRLTGATKGDAVMSLRDEGETVLFIGDDTTDETVFRLLSGSDVGIKVGPGETAAGARLTDPSAVVEFLLRLVEGLHRRPR